MDRNWITLDRPEIKRRPVGKIHKDWITWPQQSSGGLNPNQKVPAADPSGVTATIIHGDCANILPTLEADSIDAAVTDPPYNLTSLQNRSGNPESYLVGPYHRTGKGFMNQAWDSDIAFRPEVWRECLRVLKPGGHLLTFGSPRTSHRMVCAVEDAGFQVRDTLMWIHGQGFPKSLNFVGAIEKKLGHRPDLTGSSREAFIMGREWEGWGTALKPAFEPILVARKPMIGSTADNVLAHRVGGLHIDACRVPLVGKAGSWHQPEEAHKFYRNEFMFGSRGDNNRRNEQHPGGRWPSNIMHDGSPEVEGAFAAFGDRAGGSPSRFFFCAKANEHDRCGSSHPCVKPLSLMEWLVKLVTPPGGRVLDFFAGSGTTGQAACLNGFDVVLIEQEEEYIQDIKRRMAPWI